MSLWLCHKNYAGLRERNLNIRLTMEGTEIIIFSSLLPPHPAHRILVLTLCTFKMTLPGLFGVFSLLYIFFTYPRKTVSGRIAYPIQSVFGKKIEL